MVCLRSQLPEALSRTEDWYREPIQSFGSIQEIASQFIDLAMDEGVSPGQMKGDVILLEQARKAFNEQGELTK